MKRTGVAASHGLDHARAGPEDVRTRRVRRQHLRAPLDGVPRSGGRVLERRLGKLGRDVAGRVQLGVGLGDDRLRQRARLGDEVQVGSFRKRLHLAVALLLCGQAKKIGQLRS